MGRSDTKWIHFCKGSPRVLILAEMLNRFAQTRVAIKDQDQELLGKFIFQYIFREGRIGCISGNGPESTVMWYSHFFDSLSY